MGRGRGGMEEGVGGVGRGKEEDICTASSRQPRHNGRALRRPPEFGAGSASPACLRSGGTGTEARRA
eukprot:scaffold3081_cov114-Isochrysis_galbana.AAC.1